MRNPVSVETKELIYSSVENLKLLAAMLKYEVKKVMIQNVQFKGEKYYFIISDPLTENGCVFEYCCDLLIKVEHKNKDEYPLYNKYPTCGSVRRITGSSIRDGSFYIIKQKNLLDVLNLTLKFDSTWSKWVSLQKAIVMRIPKLEDSQDSKETQ